MAKSEPHVCLEKAGKLRPRWCLHLGRASDPRALHWGAALPLPALSPAAACPTSNWPASGSLICLLTIWLPVAANSPDLERVLAWQPGDLWPTAGPGSVTPPRALSMLSFPV